MGSFQLVIFYASIICLLLENMWINSVFSNQMSQIKFTCLRKSDEAIAELLFLEASGVPADWNSTAMVTVFKKQGKNSEISNKQRAFL